MENLAMRTIYRRLWISAMLFALALALEVVRAHR